jgi:hypothetical protein
MTIEIAKFRCPSCGHTMGEDTTETELLTKICENQDWVIQEQIMQIRELQNQLADYEQELYEKDLYIQGGSN